MSVYVMGRVWRSPPVEGSALLVLLALADNADDDHSWAWPSVATLMRKTRLSERTVQRALRQCEECGAIVLARPATGTKPAVYEVMPERGCQPDGGDTGDGLGVSSVRHGCHPNRKTTTKEPSQSGARETAKFRGKRVNADAWSLTQRILDEFNRQTGRKYRPLTSAGELSEAAKRVYGRVRTYPDLTFDDHAGIIRRTLRSRWWGDDEPSIGPFYGPNVFEENITRGLKAGRKASDDLKARTERALRELDE